MAPHAESFTTGSTTGSTDASATASTGLVSFDTFHNIINGQLTTTDELRHAINPATKEPNPDVPLSGHNDVDAAVSAAKAAYKKWSVTSAAARKKALLAYLDGLAAHQHLFQKLLVREVGKPMQMAQGEVDAALLNARAVASIALDLEGYVAQETDDTRVAVRYYPLSVAVGIVPWNYPFLLALNKLVAAVLVGCPIILKPSPFSPYQSLKLAEVAMRYFPAGVVQALSGDDRLGPWLTAHPGPAKISFTGSTATGRLIMASAAKTMKRVSLELGGNDPAIICGDVDVADVARQVAMFSFMNTGQLCMAIKRIYVHDSIHAQFRDALVAAAKAFKVGDPAKDPDVTLGPIQNEMQFDRVRGFLDDIEKERWNVVLGGKLPGKSPGYFIEPTIIDRPSDDSRIVREEPFGPIVPLLTWNDLDDVIERANDSEAGLGASVWSKDVERARKIAARLEAGTVWVNSHCELTGLAPFGGHKSSGLGAELGITGLKAFCNEQTIFERRLKSLL